MIVFKVVERVLGVGPRKGQKAYGAEPKSINKFSQAWLVERIVRETSLSEGDARNVIITLRNLILECAHHAAKHYQGSCHLRWFTRFRRYLLYPHRNPIEDGERGKGCVCCFIEASPHHRPLEVGCCRCTEED